MEGSVIKRAIKLSDKTQAEVAILLGVTPEHFNRMLREDVNEIYVEKIKNIGIEIDKLIKIDSQKDEAEEEEDSESDDNRLGFMPPDPITKQFLDALLIMMDRDQEKYKKLEKVLDTYDRLINQAIDTGAIKMEKK